MSIRMRHTSGHSGNRRSHHALKNKNIVTDKESGNLRLPHRLDEATGMYRGRQIVVAKVKAPKEPKAKKEKREHKHDHAVEKAAGSKGIMGRIAGAMRPKARSGAGGGGV